MRRPIATLGLLGLLLAATDASACHGRKRCGRRHHKVAVTCPAPAPTYYQPMAAAPATMPTGQVSYPSASPAPALAPPAPMIPGV